MIEPIIIDGKVKNCEVLFECNSVDDLASYKMIREGVEVTPDNAPTFDIFDIKLIAAPRSPYGFSSLFKRNPNIDEWEYMGFGHSGACSVVTALLKQLQRKEQECEELKEELTQEKLRNNDCYEQFKELRNKLWIATEALKDVINSETGNYDILFWICKHALEQIESEE